MKLVGSIVSYLFLIVVALLSLVFAFVELRSLFAGDFTLFNSPALGFCQYLFRGFFFVSLSSYCIYLFVYFLRNKILGFGHYVVAGALFASSIFTIFFYVLYVFFACIALAVIPVIIVALRKFVTKQYFHNFTIVYIIITLPEW